MSRIIVIASLVVMLFVAFVPSAFAQGPYCQPGDQWCQAAQRAQQWGQQAQQRIQRDWNNVGNDAFGQQNVQRFSQGVQNTWSQATNGGFFNCTSYERRWDAYSGQYVTVCAQ